MGACCDEDLLTGHVADNVVKGYTAARNIELLESLDGETTLLSLLAIT